MCINFGVNRGTRKYFFLRELSNQYFKSKALSIQFNSLDSSMVSNSIQAVAPKKDKKQKKSKKSDELSDALSSRLSKSQKKEIEAQADEDTGTISKEVGDLLAHLKKEHSLPDADSQPDKKKKKAKSLDTSADAANAPLTGNATSTKKLKKKKKKHGVEEKATVDDLPVAAQTGNEASPKKLNKKRKKEKVEEKETVDETVAPTKAKKKKKNSESVQSVESEPHANKKNAVKSKSLTNQSNHGQADETKPALEKKEKKQKKKKKKKQKAIADVTKKQEDDSEQAETDDEITSDKDSKAKTANANGTTEETPKTDYYLKNAFPVYVGNLPTSVKKKKLHKLFDPFGKVLAVRLRTNCGHNFVKREQLKTVPFVVAFIYFETEEAAEASVKLTGERVGDNIIYVDRDSDKKDDKPKMDVKTTVFVGNLKYQTTNAILQDTFKCCGEIMYIRVIQCKKGCNGTAYVCFQKSESVDLALKLNKTLVLDREIRVERYHTKKLGGGNSNSKENKPQLQGGALRVANKLGKESRGKPFVKNANAGKNDKKKKEFSGTKSMAKKQKKFDPKKKVKVSAMKKLANKIAPKSTA